MMARDGIPFVLVGLALTLVLLWGALALGGLLLPALCLLLGLLTLGTAFFFRDPERTFTQQADTIVSPADGRVVGITGLEHHPFAGNDTVRISIFLSILDVHVNRVPVSGTIAYVKYNPGRFVAAYKDKASEVNEQTEIGMTAHSGHRLVFRQIAGVIARRIVCRLSQGDSVAAGQRCGMIRFGSRTDLILPAGTRIDVKAGDHVLGGSTVIGRLVGRVEAAGVLPVTGSENVD